MKIFYDENREKKSYWETLSSNLKKRDVFATFLICILAASLISFQLGTRYLPTIERKANIISIIRIDGYVEDPETASLLSNVINQAVTDESIKAVVLSVDSGGGYANYVEQIYLDLIELRQKKPLIASVTTALSGGYYIAVAADYIYIHPSSFVGNVGVKASMPSVYILPEEIIETGPYKWPGFSRLLFPFNLSRILDNFVSAVETGRGEMLELSSTELKRALIYMGSDAVELGLADEIGSLQTAIGKAAQEAGLVEYQIVELKPKEAGSNVSLSLNYSLVSQNITLETLDAFHPPPALHFIYLPPQIATQSLRSSESTGIFAGGKGDVLVDLSHGNLISWWDLDVLLAELAIRNVTASFISYWSDLKSELADASLLIVASPTEVYTEEECETIESFVEEGGLLMVFFDPASEYIGWEGLMQGIMAPVNSLSTRFGFSFAKGYLYNEINNFGIYRNIYLTDFLDGNPLTQNLSSVVLFTATYVRSMNKGVALTSNDTWSSIAERTDIYAPIVLTERGDGLIVAIGDITFLGEPYCYVKDNYELILNIVQLVAGVDAQQDGDGGQNGVGEEIVKPNLPNGTEKNFTEWIDGEESTLRWIKISETETRIERPNQITSYYFTQDYKLYRWLSDGTECIYEEPLPEPPFPLIKGKNWEYISDYSLIMDGETYEGTIVATEEVEDLEELIAGNGTSYFCAKVSTTEEEHFIADGHTYSIATTGHYWISADAGTVKQEVTTQYYVDGFFVKEERRSLLLESVQKD